MGSISSDLASAQDGCEWGDCWGRWEFRKTVRRDERNLSGGWGCGAGKISRRNGKECGEAGGWGATRFGRSCWRRLPNRQEPRLIGENLQNQPKRKRSRFRPGEMKRLDR